MFGGILALSYTLKLAHCIPFVVRLFLNSISKYKWIINAFELDAMSFCNWGLHHRMYCPLSKYCFVKVSNHLCLISLTRHTLNLWLESFQHMRVQYMVQVTFTDNLIINIIWLLIAWLVPRLNASTLFFTLAMVPQSSSHCLTFTFA
jgi:hypothetical protein